MYLLCRLTKKNNNRLPKGMKRSRCSSCLISGQPLLVEMEIFRSFGLFCFVLLLPSLLNYVLCCHWLLTLSIFQNALSALAPFDVSSLGYLSQVCSDPFSLCNSCRFWSEYTYSLVVWLCLWSRSSCFFSVFTTLQANYL